LSDSTAHAAPPRTPAHLFGRLRGIPGLASVPVVALCVAVTGLLADGAVEHGDLAAHDPAVTDWFVSSRTPMLNGAAQVVTTIGSEPSIGLLTFLALVWLVLAKRAWGSAVLLAASMGAAAALTVGLKHLIGRQRPPASDVLGPLESGYAFPSGHTLFSTVFFGLVAGLLLTRIHGRASRVLVVAGWVGASAAVGTSRLYLGYHWLTDVAASWTLAVAVLAVAAAGWAVFQHHSHLVPEFLRRRLGLDDVTVAGAWS
jgi:membrane-associated phospholipid phosphatase